MTENDPHWTRQRTYPPLPVDPRSLILARQRASAAASEIEDRDIFANIKDFRGRVNAVTSEVLSAVERDGVISQDGKPHPLLAVLPDLIAATVDIRRLAVERRVANASLQQSGL